MNPAFLIPLALALWPGGAPADGVAGDFDYYVLALSWQPSWCSSTGDARDAAECDPGSKRDFTVHGLCPQHEKGWPDHCDTPERDPSRREAQALDDLMDPGLALYQWRKHGRCSGLSARDYYATMRKAVEQVAIPGLTRDAVTVTCKAQALAEVRICLTRDLRLRDCAPDVRQDCPLPRVLMEKVR